MNMPVFVDPDALAEYMRQYTEKAAAEAAEKKPPRMWLIREASQETGLSESHIRRLVHDNKIRYIRAGQRKILVNADSLIDFMNEGDHDDR